MGIRLSEAMIYLPASWAGKYSHFAPVSGKVPVAELRKIYDL
jgi:hypothetical protein